MTSAPKVYNFDADAAICMKCKKILEKKKMCGRCHTAVYCDVKCQSTDWDDHKVKCPDLLIGHNEKKKLVKIDFNKFNIDTERLMGMFDEIKENESILFDGGIGAFCYKVNKVTQNPTDICSFANKTAMFPVIMDRTQLPVYFTISLIGKKLYGAVFGKGINMIEQWYAHPNNEIGHRSLLNKQPHNDEKKEEI